MRRALVIWLVTIAVSPAATAADKWYVRVGVGNTESGYGRAQIDELGRNALLFSQNLFERGGTARFDDTDMAWSVGGGYRLSRYFALEAAYVDLGSTEYRYAGEAAYASLNIFAPPPVFLPAESAITMTTRALRLGVSGIMPIGDRFDLHGNLGLSIARTEIESTVSWLGRSQPVSRDVDDQNESIVFGVGGAFRFNERWSLSVDWNRYVDVGVGADKLGESRIGSADKEIEGDIDALTLSLNLAF